MPVGKNERHRTERISWLRAAVLGANDGILSTSSLVLGVAASHATHSSVVVAGVAGLVAGAMSMAAGEYVSVSTHRQTPKRPNSNLSAGSSKQTTKASTRS
jgi:vacuolar iron transporter family protein